MIPDIWKSPIPCMEITRWDWLCNIEQRTKNSKVLTFQEKYGTHCQHCFSSIKSVIPCHKCSWVCFCSEACRDAASASYHKYECGIMKLLLESGLYELAHGSHKIHSKIAYYKIGSNTTKFFFFVSSLL